MRRSRSRPRPTPSRSPRTSGRRLRPIRTRAVGRRSSRTGLWSVQVAAFKTQAQADGLQKQLKRAGLDAYVASAVGSDGQTNYRVRVGTFKSKVEAQRMAEQVRGERSLAAFVTPR